LPTRTSQSGTAPIVDDSIIEPLSTETTPVVVYRSVEDAVVIWTVHKGDRQPVGAATHFIIDGASTSYGRFTDTTLSPLFSALKDKYVLREEEKLLVLFRSDPRLMRVALDAHAFFDKHFPAAATPLLEALADVDGDELVYSLFIVLQTALDVDNASERLQALEQEWLTSEVDGKSLLTFDLEFIDLGSV